MDFDREEAAYACMSKKRYATADRAGKVATMRGVSGLRVYACPICQGFHLTSATLEEVVQRREVRQERQVQQDHRPPLWERLCKPMPGHEPPTADE